MATGWQVHGTGRVTLQGFETKLILGPQTKRGGLEYTTLTSPS